LRQADAPETVRLLTGFPTRARLGFAQPLSVPHTLPIPQNPNLQPLALTSIPALKSSILLSLDPKAREVVIRDNSSKQESFHASRQWPRNCGTATWGEKNERKKKRKERRGCLLFDLAQLLHIPPSTLKEPTNPIPGPFLATLDEIKGKTPSTMLAYQ